MRHRTDTAARLAQSGAVALLLCAGAVAVAETGAPSQAAGSAAAAPAALSRLAEVRPFTGPAWLNHLGIPLTSTLIGHLGDGTQDARTGPPEPTPWLDVPDAAEVPFSMTGADIYRLSCRDCHGPTGAGAPPGIPSAVALAQGMSPALLRRLHPQIPAKMASQLARGTEQALRKRLEDGGVKMPPFSYLDRQEEDALIVHLKRIAGAPDAGPEQTLEEPPARVGELIVRGSCHICHGAHQWRAPPSENVPYVSGIPSLSVFPRLGVTRIIRKVQKRGPGFVGFQRMPQFPFLTRQEIIATYLYLTRYPAENPGGRPAP